MTPHDAAVRSFTARLFDRPDDVIDGTPRPKGPNVVPREGGNPPPRVDKDRKLREFVADLFGFDPP